MRKYLLMPAVAMLAMCCLMGAACDRVKEANPIAAGCTAPDGQKVSVELCAFALYGTFVVFEGAGAKVAADLQSKAKDSKSDEARANYLNLKNLIIATDEAAKPVADSMYDATTELESIRSQLMAAGSAAPDDKAKLEQRLLYATANLQSWVDRARPKIQALTAAVRGVK